MLNNRHYCETPEYLDYSGYGEAISSCDEDDAGKFWCSNGEYGTQVLYCPFCGAKAPIGFANDHNQRNINQNDLESVSRIKINDHLSFDELEAIREGIRMNDVAVETRLFPWLDDIMVPGARIEWKERFMVIGSEDAAYPEIVVEMRWTKGDRVYKHLFTSKWINNHSRNFIEDEVNVIISGLEDEQ